MRIEFRTERRGYLLILEQDLFGALVLFRRWYGLGNRRGGVKRQIFLEEDAALREVKRIENASVQARLSKAGPTDFLGHLKPFAIREWRMAFHGCTTSVLDE